MSHDGAARPNATKGPAARGVSDPTNKTRAFFRAFFSAPTAIRGCKVASVVAPLLLVVNHGELLLRAPTSPAVLKHLALNFLVPFLVSSYSTARTAIENTAWIR